MSKDMTPKEKAEELVNNFLETIPFADTNVYEDWKKEMKNKAKKCALIAVDFSMEFITGDLSEAFDKTIYLLEVKQEIEKL